MGSETELKFQVSPQNLKKLRVVRQLRPPDDEPKKSENLLSVYFDTAECRLRRKGISLRVRHIGDYRLQTIKTQTSGIPFSRGEWEHRIDSDVPDLRLARGAPLAPLRNKISVRNWFPSSRPMYTASHVLFEKVEAVLKWHWTRVSSVLAGRRS
jgi:triphosphatase